jgi:protein-arginine kinase activator protein McsA
MAKRKKEEDEPRLQFACEKCGTRYETLADALACGCRRKDESD